MAKWDPKTEPYRVVWYHRAGALLYGWSCNSRTYATREAAIAAADQPLPAGVLKVRVDVAKLNEKGHLVGWAKVSSRSRQKKRPQPVAALSTEAE